MTSWALQVFGVVTEPHYSFFPDLPLIYPRTIFLYSQLLTLATAVAMADVGCIHCISCSLCQVCWGSPGKQACDHAAMGQRQAWREAASQECLSPSAHGIGIPAFVCGFLMLLNKAG